MTELSLFSGAGGGLLGSKLLGWKTIGYVEYEEYCQKILKQRIADGILDAAPIFGDIRKFISEGYADAYQGMVDIVTGGFPCQPFSVAGKGLGEADPRNMWPQTIEVIRRVKPRFAFLENVPGLMGKPYFRTILRQIAESGYDCRWCVLGASDVGANHRRKRLWILAYSKSWKSRQQTKWKGRENFSGGSKKIDVANPESERKGTKQKFSREGYCIVNGSQDVAESEIRRFSERFTEKTIQSNVDCGSLPRGKNNGNWWDFEPRVGRVAHGIPSRVDRLKSLGNAQVPIQMAYAFSKLSEGIVE